MGGTGNYDVKQSEPSSEGQILHVLPYMWNLDLKNIDIDTHIHRYIYKKYDCD
jgi:hypothetical protein